MWNKQNFLDMQESEDCNIQERIFIFLKNGYLFCSMGPCFNFSTKATCKNTVGFIKKVGDGFL